MIDQSSYIEADWPAPANVHALTTTRQGGVSRGEYASLNLADHVGDNVQAVEENRRSLCAALNIKQPVWLKQVHGITVVDSAWANTQAEADAIFTTRPNDVCAVMTADCLPLLFCNRQGTRVAAAHAGWRGLAGGVIEATVDALQQPAEDLLVWLGPAIGPQHFEVGHEVYQAFVEQHEQAAEAFVQTDAEHYLADIYQLARIRLQQKNIQQVYGGGLCTYDDESHFYSFRRNAITGRMASLIWINE